MRTSPGELVHSPTDALHRAAERGDTAAAEVERLLAAGLDPSSADPRKARWRGEDGADVDAPSFGSAVCAAARAGAAALVMRLLEREEARAWEQLPSSSEGRAGAGGEGEGVKVRIAGHLARNGERFSDALLFAAAEGGNAALLRWLLDRYAGDWDDSRPVMISRASADSGADEAVNDRMASRFPMLSMRTTPLHGAAFAGRLDIVRYLVEERHVDPDPQHAYLCARGAGAKEPYGADDPCEGRPLFEAARLLQRGTDSAWPPLLDAVGNGHVGAARLLAARGASLRARGRPRAFEFETGGDPPEALLTPLEVAAARGQNGSIEWLLEQGAPLAPVGASALYLAARGGHEATCRLLVARGAPVNGRCGQNSRTPLHGIAAGYSRPCVLALLELGANPEARDRAGATALHAALAEGWRRRAGPSRGFDWNRGEPDPDALEAESERLRRESGDPEGWAARAALEALEERDRVDAVRALLEGAAGRRASAAAAEASGEGGAPLHLAAWGAAPAEVFGLLMAAGADVNAETAGGWTPLALAAGRCAAPVLSLLLSHGADPARCPRNPSRRLPETPFAPGPPLCEAAHRPAALRALLGAGADPNAADADGATPLLRALLRRAPDACLEILLEAGSDPGRPCARFGAPLVVACGYESRGSSSVCCPPRSPAIVRRLLQGGRADPNAKDTEGATPLVRALRHGSGADGEAIVHALLDAGASLNVESPWGTPLHVACYYSDFLGDDRDDRDGDGRRPQREPLSPSVAGRLLSMGADPNALAAAGRLGVCSPLHAAVQVGPASRAEELVRILLRAGANPNAATLANPGEAGEQQEGTGETPIARAPTPEIARLLLEAGAALDPASVPGAGAVSPLLTAPAGPVLRRAGPSPPPPPPPPPSL
eukprot:tig00000190_g13846.t1